MPGSGKKVRAGLRGRINVLVNEIEPMIKGTIEPDHERMYVILMKLENYLSRLESLDSEVVQNLIDDGKEKEADEDSEKAVEYNDRVLSYLARLKRMVEQEEHSLKVDSGAQAQSTKNPSPGEGIKRPRIKLPEFAGDILEFRSFWDLFTAAVHNDKGLSDVEKFSYLMGSLKGEAQGMLQGYDLTSANYQEAVKALKERYDDPQRAQIGYFLSMLEIDRAKNRRADLQHVFDQCERHIRSLISLGLAEDTFSVVFVPIILSKLPFSLAEDLTRKNGKQQWRLSNVREWVREELCAYEVAQTIHPNDRAKASTNASGGSYGGRGGFHKGGSASILVTNSGRNQNSSFRNQSSGNYKSRCNFCSGDHSPHECRKFPTSGDRVAEVKRFRLCFSCLRPGHEVSECATPTECTYCHMTGHHRSLCHTQFRQHMFRDYGATRGFGGTRGVRGAGQSGWYSRGFSRPQRQNLRPHLNAAAPEFIPQPQRESVNVAADSQPVSVSFLPTAWVTLSNRSTNFERQGRVLLDTASSRTYITEEMCRRLGLKVISESYMSVARFGSNKRTTSVAKRVELDIRCLDGSVIPIVANVTPIISSPVSRIPIDMERFPFVKTVKLAEPWSDKPDSLPLDVLVGSDFYYQFVLPQIITSDDGLTLVSSRLGFLTAGSMSVLDCEGTENTLILALVESAPGHRDPYEMFDFERFWRLEEIGVHGKEVNDISDEQALATFYSTLKFENGRYWVTWFWKTENPDLPDNAKLAYARLHSTLGRLKRTPELLTQYDEIIQNQLKQGVIEVAPEVPTGPVYYVPHHEVVTPSKVTTKLRIVYDASSKCGKHALSLNDCMHRGIVVLEDLCGLLTRFRTWRYGIVADIEKAFLQVGLQETERDVARFYWVRDLNRPLTADNIVIYRFTRVFFGAIGSPSLLGSTLDAHARRVESDITQTSDAREMAKAFRENVYSDNHVGGEDSAQKAVVHYKETKKLCQGASMNLREFYSNSGQLRSLIDPADLGKSFATKVLGVHWDLQTDMFHCSSLKNPLSGVKQVTKRDVVREVAQTFDPCGWYAPVVLLAKGLIQQIWKQEIGWDEQLPHDLLTQWNKYRSNLAKISTVEIPRYVGSVRQEHQLHAFCDASLKASAVAVYLRTELGGTVVCNLLMSKTRLAPLNPSQTIPRLELISVELGVRLLEFTSVHLRGQGEKKFVWSDSQCVLAWIKNEKLTTKFVQRRVEEIRTAKGVEFRFVSGLDNPADIPSRGAFLDELVSNSVWWHGPAWLSQEESNWPTNVLKFESVANERTRVEGHVLTTPDQVEEKPWFDFARHSTLSKALRTLAYVFRAVTPLLQRSKGPITLFELDKARVVAEKMVQKRAFPLFDTWSTTKRGMPASMSALHVYRDYNGLLRSRSRLQNSDLPFEAQNPVILPKYDWFTQLVIQHAHVQCNHAGVAQTLAAIREKYWIVQGKPMVKSVLQDCMHCRRAEGGSYRVPSAPPLPEFRVTQNAPFAYTGLDYLGPLLVRTDLQSKVLSKVWISLFTCALIRAVHLEVVESQSAHEFHLALRRFIATYGAPQLIVSDNASQFKTVESAITKLCPTEIDHDIAVKFGVAWRHIPEVGPWMGGFYERMIGVVKKFLKKALNGAVVTLSELRTVVAEIQFTVNSRPLLTMEADNSLYSLCPNDFLGKPRKVCFPTFHEAPQVVRRHDVPGAVVENWKRLQRLSAKFWDMWRQGYLTCLREKYSNARQNNPSALIPSVGSVVQIKETKMPRARWLLGKIERLVPSNDTKVRSVVVKLANGKTLIRPIKLLYPLEMGIRGGGENSDQNDFEGFDPTDVDRLRNMLQSLTNNTVSGGGTQA